MKSVEHGILCVQKGGSLREREREGERFSDVIINGIGTWKDMHETLLCAPLSLHLITNAFAFHWCMRWV